MPPVELSRPVEVAAKPSLARDLLALGKPHITVLSVLTGAAGMWLAPGPAASPGLTVATLAGLALLVAGAHALNQYLERDVDALMERTRSRPLPDLRLRPSTALVAGLVAAGLALAVLGVFANLLAALLGALALNLYVLVYTPLKRLSPHALLVGAVPGAMPVLIGWSAVEGSLGLPGLALFLVVALWQVPHFVAIALFRRDDYARAGIRTVVAVSGEVAAKRQALVYSGWLCAAGLLLPASRASGWLALSAGLLAGGAMWLGALRGMRPEAGPRWARGFFRLSLIYLPALLLALGVERILR
jgi:heme o synthase